MVWAVVKLFCYRNMVRKLLLQIYGAAIKPAFCYRNMVVKVLYHGSYISCGLKQFRNKLQPRH